jgi:hypothetical protein
MLSHLTQYLYTILAIKLDGITQTDTVLETASCMLNVEKYFFQCMRLEVSSLLKIHIVVSCAMMPYNLIDWFQGFAGMYSLNLFPEDRASMLLRNVGEHVPHNTVS